MYKIERVWLSILFSILIYGVYELEGVLTLFLMALVINFSYLFLDKLDDREQERRAKE